MSILCYHSVDASWRSLLAVSPDEFAAQCAWLARQRSVVDLSRAVEMLDGGFGLPSGSVAITFDDGFAGLAEHAYPILQRHGLPATIFLVASTLGSEPTMVDWVIGEQPPPPQTLSTEQVLAMQDGGVTFGSHSMSHRDLTQLSDDECERELRSSREAIGEILGRPCRFLAYPGGRHDARVRRIAERAGYDAAFTLPEEREPRGRFSVPRVGVYPGNGVWTLRIKDSPWYLPVRTSRWFIRSRRVVETFTRDSDHSA